jgi:4,5-DOPA dioxygenase extradiol
MAEILPAVFFDHGNPMNALRENSYTAAWRRLGQQMARPKSIVCISAHWYVPGTGVTVTTATKTIHDFGGFPPELHEVQYPAPGDPELAQRVKQMLAPVTVVLDENWGLDHGTWSVLKHVYPDAYIPVVQLSIDATQPASFHFEVGKKLAPLRGEGTLILGSGNLVHNLYRYTWGRSMPEPYDWAIRFETIARELMIAGEYAPLIDYERLGPDAILSIPTPEHFLPLLYVLATSQASEDLSFPAEGFDGGSISMLTAKVG